MKTDFVQKWTTYHKTNSCLLQPNSRLIEWRIPEKWFLFRLQTDICTIGSEEKQCICHRTVQIQPAKYPRKKYLRELVWECENRGINTRDPAAGNIWNEFLLNVPWWETRSFWKKRSPRVVLVERKSTPIITHQLLFRPSTEFFAVLARTMLSTLNWHQLIRRATQRHSAPPRNTLCLTEQILQSPNNPENACQTWHRMFRVNWKTLALKYYQIIQISVSQQ